MIIIEHVLFIYRASMINKHLPGTRKIDMNIAWKPPEVDSFKINTNGAAKGVNGAAGCGGLIRDDHGHWIAGYTCNLGSCSAFKAEA